MARHKYVGETFVIVHMDDGGWTHGICVGVTLTPTGRSAWLRLRFPDHSEKSYRPSRLRHAIPFTVPS